MADRRVYDRELFAHFVTVSCYRRRRLLDHDQAKRILLGVLNRQLSIQKATCVGFVVMPDHVHVIVWFPQTGQFSRFMQGWKRRSSYEIHRWYQASPAQYLQSTNSGDPFWQPKYYSFEIYSEAKLIEKLTYMHLNPVRAGLVEQAVDWTWSSARWYELGKSVGVPIGWIV